MAAWGKDKGRALAASHFRTLLLCCRASSLAHSDINLSKALQQSCQQFHKRYTWNTGTLTCKMQTLKMPPLVPVIWILWAGGEVVQLATSPSWGLWLQAGPNPATTALASVRAGAPKCEQIQTKFLQIKLEEFPFASEPSELGSPWSTTTWIDTAHQACTTHSTVPGQPQELGCWGYTGLTAGEWALVLLLSMTKSLIKHQAAKTVNSELKCFFILPEVSVFMCPLELHVLTIAYHVGVQLPIFCISHPPFSSSSSQSFQSFSKCILPSSLFQDPSFFLSIFQLSAPAVVLSFWRKTGYQSLSPQLHTSKFRPPHLPGTFKWGIKHCTWQRFPDPAQTIIKFLCLRTCWTQTLFSLAREANLLLEINIKQTGIFWL